MDKKFVYIGIPSRTKGFWDCYTALTMACNIAAQNGIFCAIEPHVGSSLICRARQNITYKFLYEQPQCNYFLQLDDDIQIPQDGIVKLVESNKNVIGGMYSLKSKAGKIALRALGDKIINVKDHPDEIIPIKYISTGCFMQTRDVVQRAWDYYKKDRSYIANPRRNDNDISLDRVALYTPFIYEDEYLSEDWAYCQRLIDMGEDLFIHTGVKCVHWGLAPYGIV